MKQLRLAVFAALTAGVLATAACGGNDRARVSPEGLRRAVSGRAQGERSRPAQSRGNGGSAREKHDNGRRGNGKGHGNGNANGHGNGNGHHE